jgi:DNA-binding transcriptional MocR family regulator
MLVEAAKDIRVGAILCSPTLHNPTNATMPLERRREILAIAAKLDTCVIEDDSNGHLSGDERPTMTSINPDRCIYLCGTSKSMAPGLRIGYMVAPTSILPRLSEGVHATSWTSPSLMGEITSVLIEERIAENFLSWHRKEAVERMKMAENILGLSGIFPNCPTYHLWLQLPAPWRANEFAAHLRLGNTLVSPADVFAVDRNPTPHAIRVSLGGVAERSRLAEGLRVIAEALTARPSSFSMAI